MFPTWGKWLILEQKSIIEYENSHLYLHTVRYNRCDRCEIKLSTKNIFGVWRHFSAQPSPPKVFGLPPLYTSYDSRIFKLFPPSNRLKNYSNWKKCRPFKVDAFFMGHPVSHAREFYTSFTNLPNPPNQPNHPNSPNPRTIRTIWTLRTLRTFRTGAATYVCTFWSRK